MAATRGRLYGANQVDLADDKFWAVLMGWIYVVEPLYSKAFTDVWTVNKKDLRTMSNTILFEGDWVCKDVYLSHSPILGFAATCKSPIPEGMYIAPYTGVVKIGEAPENKSKVIPLNIDGFPDAYIDSRERGNWSRFIHHSETPNCTSEVWSKNSMPILLIRANQDIFFGEQLTLKFTHLTM